MPIGMSPGGGQWFRGCRAPLAANVDTKRLTGYEINGAAICDLGRPDDAELRLRCAIYLAKSVWTPHTCTRARKLADAVAEAFARGDVARVTVDDVNALDLGRLASSLKFDAVLALGEGDADRPTVLYLSTMTLARRRQSTTIGGAAPWNT